jgi:hypothetical protein
MAVMLAVVSLLVLGQPPATPVAASPYSSFAQAGPIVRCEPRLPAPGIVGANPVDVVVDMYIENVVDLYGVDLRVSFFDTTIAQVVDQLPATGVQNQPLDTFLQPDFVVRNTVDNTAGTMRYAATQLSPNVPVGGSGPVARITFHGLQAGTFTMTWGTVELSDIDGRKLSATTQPCVVSFQTSEPQDNAIIRCQPTTPAPGVIGGADAVVDMYIENVVGLNAVDLSISFFDTTIAHAVDQLPPAGVQIEPLSTFFHPDWPVVNIADNAAGTIQYAASQMGGEGGHLPVTGSGPVARITFHGLQEGTFPAIWGTVELSDIDGRLIPATVEACEISFVAGPTLVRLNRFEARPAGRDIEVQWETAQEIDTLGFNLYRSATPDGWKTRVNEQLILTKVPLGSPSGATYVRIDKHRLDSGRTYYYWLEELDLHGRSSMHGPVTIGPDL